MVRPKHIGKYEILGQIAVGGFGVIYKGWDPYIKRTVAIKMCATEDAEVSERFHREAEFVGNLVHRNITLVFDFGIEHDVPYIVQEYLTGYDLDDLLKAGVLVDPTAVVSILTQVCDGLQFAHERGIVHRDIKPSNIRILEDGTVKLMDFGIAKSLGTSARLTQTGIALGTAGYLAPEQIQGDTVDARTDLFALGVVGYEMATGIRPFDGNTLSNVLFKILNQEPRPVRDLEPRCPTLLDATLLRCLAKAPGDRFQTAADLADALQRIPEERPSGSWRDESTSILRTLVGTMDRDSEAATNATRTPRDLSEGATNQGPVRTPDAARLHHGPPLEDSTDSHRRSPVLLLFLVMLLLLVGSSALVILNRDVQNLVFPDGVPWSTTPTPVVSVAATPTPTPTPEPAAAPTHQPSNPSEPASAVEVRLLLDPPAALAIDGRAWGEGRLQGATVNLEPGLHSFTLTVPDYPPQTLTRRVGPAGGTVLLNLDIGTLTVTLDPTAPPGATAYLDGAGLGPVPIVRRKVPAGEHELVVRWPDHEPFREVVQIPRVPNDPLVRVVAPPAAPAD